MQFFRLFSSTDTMWFLTLKNILLFAGNFQGDTLDTFLESSIEGEQETIFELGLSNARDHDYMEIFAKHGWPSFRRLCACYLFTWFCFLRALLGMNYNKNWLGAKFLQRLE